MSNTIHYFDECVVCNEPNPLYLFKPCNHKCICTTCAKTYTESRDLQTCPLCRKEYASIERDDSKPKNVTMNEDEQLAMALSMSLHEAQEQEAKRKREESIFHQQFLSTDLEARPASEISEHKRILSSIIDLVKREASRVASGLHQSLPRDMMRGSQYAREETELRLIQNVENAFSRIKESIKLRRSIQMDEWRESQDSSQELFKQLEQQRKLQEITLSHKHNEVEESRSPTDSSKEEARSTQSYQASSSCPEKTYANLVKTSPVRTIPVRTKVVNELRKSSSISDVSLIRRNSTEAFPSQQLASITFNEIIDVTMDGASSVNVRPHGFMSLYLPSKLAHDVATIDKKIPKFMFHARKSDSLENFIVVDGLLTELHNRVQEEENLITFSKKQSRMHH